MKLFWISVIKMNGANVIEKYHTKQVKKQVFLAFFLVLRRNKGIPDSNRWNKIVEFSFVCVGGTFL